MKNIAIVTGASSGMGKEFALQISKKVAIDEIWLIARSKEKLNETAKVIKLETTVEPKVIPLDLTKDDSFTNIQKRLAGEKDNVKILVNSSGFGISGNVIDMDMDRQAEMIDLNCKALFKLTHICLPYMTRGSNVVQIASAAAYVPQPKFAVYAATKSFVLSLSIALHNELKEYGIGVTAVCPGPVDTNFFKANDKNNAEFSKFAKVILKSPQYVAEKSIKAVDKKKMVVNTGLAVKLLYLATCSYKKIFFAFLSKSFYR